MNLHGIPSDWYNHCLPSLHRISRLIVERNIQTCGKTKMSDCFIILLIIQYLKEIKLSHTFFEKDGQSLYLVIECTFLFYPFHLKHIQ